MTPLQAVLGLTLFATIALPITTDGPSLLDFLLHVGRQNPVQALVLLGMLGSPHLFGLAVAYAGISREDVAVRATVTWTVAIMQGMIVMFAVNISGAEVVAPLALLGFAVVTGLYLPFASGEAAASSRERLSLRWYVRWGALLIVGVGLWLRLQAMAGLAVGPAIDVALATAALLLASLARREPPRASE